MTDIPLGFPSAPFPSMFCVQNAFGGVLAWTLDAVGFPQALCVPGTVVNTLYV